MTRDGAAWLADHVNGPNREGGPFKCFWCGGRVTTHHPPCPAYDAIHQLDTEKPPAPPTA